MVLARILAPELFGLVAMANITITLVATMRDIGLAEAFVQRESANDEELNLAASTTFWMLCAANALLFVIAWVGAPAVAVFFKSGEVVPLLRVLVVLFLLDAVSAGPAMILRRRLDFKTLATGEIAGSIAAASVSVGLAVTGHGVWSLIFGQLSGRIVIALSLYGLSGWRPAFRFSRELAGELFRFGKHLWAFSILSAFGGMLDRLIVGRSLGAGSLGVYHMGSNLANLPAQQISFLANRVTFPAFARMQDDPGRMRAALRKALAHVSIVTLPVALGTVAVAPQLIGTAYGVGWEAAIPVVQVLAFYGMTLSISSVTGPIFQATGKPQVLLYTGILHHTLLITLLLLLSRFGVMGIVSAVVIPVQVSALVAFVLVLRYLDAGVWDLFGPCVRSAVAAAVMYGATRLARAPLEAAGLALPVQLAILVGLGAGVYLGASYLINRAEIRDFFVTLRALVRPQPAERQPATP